MFSQNLSGGVGRNSELDRSNDGRDLNLTFNDPNRNEVRFSRDEDSLPNFGPDSTQQQGPHRGNFGAQEEILSNFTESEQALISHRLKVLSVIPLHVGKDFSLVVELNQPGCGWHWEPHSNKVRVDPVDLLEKPLNYLRFVFAHEGGHCRISDLSIFADSLLRTPGFLYLYNCIEDPRDNNFISDADPVCARHLREAYPIVFEAAEQKKREAKGKLGHIPLSSEAGFEFIKEWYHEITGSQLPGQKLPKEVQALLEKTRAAAAEAWWVYPSTEELTRDPIRTNRRYAQHSGQIIAEKIWPEFEALVLKDIETQRTQQFLKGKRKGNGKGKGTSGQGSASANGAGGQAGNALPEPADPQKPRQKNENKPEEKKQDEERNQQNQKPDKNQDKKQEPHPIEQELKDTLTAEEMEKLLKEMEKPSNEAVDLEELSEESREKLKQHIDGLPEDERKKLEELAKKALREHEKELNEELSGKLNPKPENDIEAFKRMLKEQQQKLRDEINRKWRKGSKQDEGPEGEDSGWFSFGERDDLNQFRDELQMALDTNKTYYDAELRRILPTVDATENALRKALKLQKPKDDMRSGNRTGFTIDIHKREQEIAKDVKAPDSRAWEAPRPDPEDKSNRRGPLAGNTAVTLLIDLSNSMEGRPITHAFRGAVALTETCSRLGIKTEVLGFNNHLSIYKKFEDSLADDVRERMGHIVQDIGPYTDTGWAMRKAAERMDGMVEKHKFLIVLGDGDPCTSPGHGGKKNALRTVHDELLKTGGPIPIVIDISPRGSSSSKIFRYSVTKISVEQLPEKIGEVLANIFEDKYRGDHDRTST